MSEPTFLGHPRGLVLLFLVEMWERFSYYGMRALLVLYLVNELGRDIARATNLYGSYTSPAYITPLVVLTSPILRDLRCDFVRCRGAALHAGTQDQQAYRWS
ncbi:MAG: hypothetical protein ABIR58_03575 [Gemmatimonadaceae bacterium]